MATKVIVQLKKVKETKGAVRFDSPEPNAVVGNVYVRKPAGMELGETVTLTIEKA